MKVGQGFLINKEHFIKCVIDIHILLFVCSALVWGTSVKHCPQKVGKEHILNDEDVVQILKKSVNMAGHLSFSICLFLCHCLSFSLSLSLSHTPSVLHI